MSCGCGGGVVALPGEAPVVSTELGQDVDYSGVALELQQLPTTTQPARGLCLFCLLFWIIVALALIHVFSD